MAYWFTSSRTARAAASLTDSGAGKSGNPWARFTPPCCWHRRVISRITDSVNRVLRSETRGRMGLSYYRPAGARPKRRLSGTPRPFGAAGQPPLPLLGARRGSQHARPTFCTSGALRTLTTSARSPSFAAVMDAQRGIARRFVIGLPPEGIGKAWEKDFSAFPPAGVIIFKRDFRDLEDLRLLTARLRDLARPRRLFIATDEEGGHVSQLAGHLVVPPNALLLGRGAEPGDIEWVSRVTAERLRALGIDWVFAPVADVHSRALNPVIGPRAFSTAPGEVAERVAEAVRGLRAGGVASCLKHFPGHGDTVLDSHLALPTCTAPRAELAQR